MSNISTDDTSEIAALNRTAAASLAGGIIAASGKQHSVEEALEVFNDVFWMMFPEPGNGRYTSWKNEQTTKNLLRAASL